MNFTEVVHTLVTKAEARQKMPTCVWTVTDAQGVLGQKKAQVTLKVHRRERQGRVQYLFTRIVGQEELYFVTLAGQKRLPQPFKPEALAEGWLSSSDARELEFKLYGEVPTFVGGAGSGETPAPQSTGIAGAVESFGQRLVGGLSGALSYFGPKIELVTGVDNKQYRVANGTYYHAETPDEVIKVLERARSGNSRVRVFYGDVETGKDWMEENDTTGTVNRSMGPIKIPLLIATQRSGGGGGLLTHCIVRIKVGGKDAYRLPKYHQGNLEVRTADGVVDPEFQAMVYQDGDNVANFRKKEQADRWVAFIKGDRDAK